MGLRDGCYNGVGAYGILLVRHIDRLAVLDDRGKGVLALRKTLDALLGAP